MLFSAAQRAAVREENPSLTLGEVGKQLGARYKELSAEERAHWQQQADPNPNPQPLPQP